MSVCTCGAVASQWRPHQLWCPQSDQPPPLTNVGGRNILRRPYPEHLRGVLHEVTFSGCADGSLRAQCATCMELGRPWSTTLEGFRYTGDKLAKLAYQHSGLKRPEDRLVQVREWVARRLEPKRGRSLHWRLALRELRNEVSKILDDTGIN